MLRGPMVNPVGVILCTINFRPPKDTGQRLIFAMSWQLLKVPGMSITPDTLPMPEMEIVPFSAKVKPLIVPKPPASISRLLMTTSPLPCRSSVAPGATETDSQFPSTLNDTGVSGVPRIGA